MDPSAILKIWPHCFTLDFYGHDSGPVFRAVGINFSGYYSGKLANLPVSDLTPGTLTALSRHFFGEVLEKNAPDRRVERSIILMEANFKSLNPASHVR